jgi:hypothetical protein
MFWKTFCKHLSRDSMSHSRAYSFTTSRTDLKMWRQHDAEFKLQIGAKDVEEQQHSGKRAK